MRFTLLRLPRSLALRTLLTSVSALMLVMAFIGGAFAFVLSWQKEPFAWEGFWTDVAKIDKGMRFGADGRLDAIVFPGKGDEFYEALPGDVAFQVMDGNGREVLASQPGPALAALRSSPMQMTQGVDRVANSSVPLQMMTSTVRRGGSTYVIRVARSERLGSVLRTSGSQIVLMAGLATAILAVIVFSCIVLWAARRAARPLNDVSAAAAAIEPGNLKQRLDGSALPSELIPLIDAFNKALERLEQGYRVQQEFLALAAHELKTPLSLIRAEIEMGMVSSADRSVLLRDVDGMARQVQQLLQLAEASESHNYVFKSLDVVAVLDEAVAYASRLAGMKGVRVNFVCDLDSLMRTADPGALSILAKNLIENAIHHSPAGGVVTVSLDRSGFLVCDCGPGVRTEDVPRLFTRFWRSAHAPHDGAGLGLSICKEIAMAHRWHLSHRPPQSGPGASFGVSFHDGSR